jgi:hypothetical protein
MLPLPLPSALLLLLIASSPLVSTCQCTGPCVLGKGDLLHLWSRALLLGCSCQGISQGCSALESQSGTLLGFTRGLNAVNNHSKLSKNPVMLGEKSAQLHKESQLLHVESMLQTKNKRNRRASVAIASTFSDFLLSSSLCCTLGASSSLCCATDFCEKENICWCLMLGDETNRPVKMEGDGIEFSLFCELLLRAFAA